MTTTSLKSQRIIVHLLQGSRVLYTEFLNYRVLTTLLTFHIAYARSIITLPLPFPGVTIVTLD